jgi:hypothetical protein
VKIDGVRVTLVLGLSEGLASGVRGAGGCGSVETDGAGADSDSGSDTGSHQLQVVDHHQFQVDPNARIGPNVAIGTTTAGLRVSTA